MVRSWYGGIDMSDEPVVTELPQITIKTIAHDPTGRIFLELLMVLGFILLVWGFIKKNEKFIVIGFLLIVYLMYVFGFFDSLEGRTINLRFW